MSAEFLTAQAAHKEKRRRECAKVEPAIPWDEIDIGFDPPDVYDDYTADPRADYADSVGMPLHERMR